jgi:hypothetical protein
MSVTALSCAAFSIMRQPRSRLSAVTVLTALSSAVGSRPGTWGSAVNTHWLCSTSS